MKKILMGSVAFFAMTAAASAADLAARPYTKAPAMIAAVYDWSGFYIGANAGYGTQRDCRRNVTTSVDLGCYDADGAVAGGQIGYRWQSSAWVFGLEAQGDWADLKGTTQNLGNAANSLSTKMDAFGLFTAQIGYAWNNTLLYVKGGAAVTDRRYDFITNATGANAAFASYDTRWGGTAGVGLEYGFTPNWSFAIEYDHIFENRHTTGFTATASGLPLAATYSSGGDTDLVTARINYKWGGPVIAKY